MHFNTDHDSLQNEDYLQLRSRVIHAVIVTSLSVLGMGGCAAKQSATSAPPHARPPVVITESGADKPITLSVGQTLRVRLAANPTTGYSWSVQQTPGEFQLVQSTYAADAQGRNLAGAGGYQTIEFAAKFAGKGELKLEYRRGWEKDAPPAKTFAVPIQ
jgi:inhibitor of cysteine peptidase